MKELLLVGTGGFFGSVLRYLAGAAFLRTFPDARFPWATFAVNISGCLAIGVIASILERTGSYNSELRLLLVTGVLGGFTTFSAFGLETLHLLRGQHIGLGVFNAVSSVALGVFAVWVGFKLGARAG